MSACRAQERGVARAHRAADAAAGGELGRLQGVCVCVWCGEGGVWCGVVVLIRGSAEGSHQVDVQVAPRGKGGKAACLKCVYADVSMVVRNLL